jgi:hypothetical protein
MPRWGCQVAALRLGGCPVASVNSQQPRSLGTACCRMLDVAPGE